jgi:hypothetical protein
VSRSYRRFEPQLRRLIPKTWWFGGGEQIQGFDKALDVVRTPRETIRVAEDNADVFGGPAKYGEVCDVLGDKNSSVQCGQRQQDIVFESREGW